MDLGRCLGFGYSFGFVLYKVAQSALHDSLGYKGGMHHMHLFSDFKRVWFFDPLRSGEE